MAVERQSPDVLLDQTNLSGAVSAIQDDPDTPDASWLTAISNNAASICQTSFPTPTGNPTVGADLQEFKIWVRKMGGTGTPKVRIELYENNVFLATLLADTNVTSTSGVLHSGTWNANLLGTADGSLVECRVYGTQSGGSPSVRAAIEVGAVEWNVDYTIPPANRRGQVSWAELETPDAPRRGQISWSELETPDAPRRGQVSWAELEVPAVSADRRGQVSWAELEAPDAPRRGQISWVELETPDIPRRGQVSWIEFEVPSEPRRGQISWSELEVPNAPPTYTTYGSAFLWTVANWGTVNVYLEVYIRATAGTVYARLIDSNNSPVTNSEVSTNQATFQRLRSATLTLTNNLTYRIQFGKAGGDAGEFLGARVIIIPV